jgi:hypothetical protein
MWIDMESRQDAKIFEGEARRGLFDCAQGGGVETGWQACATSVPASGLKGLFNALTPHSWCDQKCASAIRIAIRIASAHRVRVSLRGNS